MRPPGCCARRPVRRGRSRQSAARGVGQKSSALTRCHAWAKSEGFLLHFKPGAPAGQDTESHHHGRCDLQLRERCQRVPGPVLLCNDERAETGSRVLGNLSVTVSCLTKNGGQSYFVTGFCFVGYSLVIHLYCIYKSTGSQGLEI